MSTEELLEKAEKEYRDSIVFYRDVVIKRLADLDASAETVNMDSILEDFKCLVDSVHYLEAVQMLQDENFVKEL